MDPIEAAGLAMEIKTARFQQDYGMALERKVMDQSYQAVEAIAEMMPVPPKGEYVDVYA